MHSHHWYADNWKEPNFQIKIAIIFLEFGQVQSRASNANDLCQQQKSDYCMDTSALKIWENYKNFRNYDLPENPGRSWVNWKDFCESFLYMLVWFGSTKFSLAEGKYFWPVRWPLTWSKISIDRWEKLHLYHWYISRLPISLHVPCNKGFVQYSYHLLLWY